MSSVLNDSTMRAAFVAGALAESLQEPDTILVHELRIAVGQSRADIVVLNGLMHGYELKSEADCLIRLPKQRRFYNQVFDRVDLVVHRRHRREALRRVSPWWGVSVMEQSGDGALTLHHERKSSANPCQEAYWVASLLWKNEALELCAERGVPGRFRSRPKHIIWQALASTLGVEVLRSAVRDILKRRYRERVLSALSPCDDSSALPSTGLGL